MLAHALEEGGIATVQLASIRVYVEKMHPPRALYCEFPLGRPLGKPDDPAFQRSVLEAAFALLERPSGPVLEDFPEVIVGGGNGPLACTIPPRATTGLPAAVEEAVALRGAYDRQLARSGRTIVGGVVSADSIPDAVAAIVRLVETASLDEAALPGSPRDVANDIRAYYEEAALALADHVPAARQSDAWFFGHTQAGALLRRVPPVLRAEGASESEWQFFLPSSVEEVREA